METVEQALKDFRRILDDAEYPHLYELTITFGEKGNLCYKIVMLNPYGVDGERVLKEGKIKKEVLKIEENMRLTPREEKDEKRKNRKNREVVEKGKEDSI
ncbi:hypothetical protein COS91_06570 [Candidatus Desantisbacteria bacterium CG07_land_8_20_14_0_80_39_15]|uniref:Uncharacterized protein n=1 Tax=Candidatus Desantisbacteria bacterium CG07_land_8_20_14_0_80_39_15 TaxID=1974549 RepID=A0A2M6ZF68_9BACT|nr:MAG: hypothetical protein COS91_06570 [Candidatus Desantisbacteria bacterium CG07_land_8_20_14_0_80_39_15]